MMPVRGAACLLALTAAHASLVIHVRTPRGIVACADKRVTGAGTSDRYIKLIPSGDACVYAATGNANTFWSKGHTELEYSVYAVIDRFFAAAPCSDGAVDLDALGTEIERSLLAAAGKNPLKGPAPSSVVIVMHRDDTGRLRTGRCRITTRLDSRNVITAVNRECKDTSGESVLAYGDTAYLKQLAKPGVNAADAAESMRALIRTSAELGASDISPTSDCVLLPETGAIEWLPTPEGEYPPR